MGLAIENREGTAVAMCESSGFRPKTVNVTWTRQNQSEPDFTPTVTDMGNNTFTLVSQYLWPLNRSHNGNTLTCSVSHMALNQPVTQTITISVLCTYVHNTYFQIILIPLINVLRVVKGVACFVISVISFNKCEAASFLLMFFNSPGKSYLV